MSGRIRTIKPEILEDAVTAGLSDMAFRVFVASICLADDYGRLRAEPGWLMGQIYWLRTVSSDAFLAAWQELRPLIQSYTVNGQRYAAIRSWNRHQKVSHPGKPRIPQPPDSLGDSPEILAKPSGESPETLVPDLRSPTNDHRPTTTDHQAGSENLAAPPVAAVAEPSVSEVRTTKRKRPGAVGTRIPDTWVPGPSVAEWAAKQGIADYLAPLEEFRDFWRAATGPTSVKADWDATYRNRLRDLARMNRIEVREPVQSTDDLGTSEQHGPPLPLDEVRRQFGDPSALLGGVSRRPAGLFDDVLTSPNDEPLAPVAKLPGAKR